MNDERGGAAAPDLSKVPVVGFTVMLMADGSLRILQSPDSPRTPSTQDVETIAMRLDRMLMTNKIVAQLDATVAQRNAAFLQRFQEQARALMPTPMKDGGAGEPSDS